MFPILFTSDIIAARQNDLLKDAQRHRLLRQARSARPDFQDRLLTSLGRLMISAGTRLQESYAPVAPHSRAPCPSEC